MKRQAPIDPLAKYHHMTVEAFLRQNIAAYQHPHPSHWRERWLATGRMVVIFPAHFLGSAGLLTSFRTGSWGKKFGMVGFFILMLLITLPVAAPISNLLPNFFPGKLWFELIQLAIGYYLVGVAMGIIVITFLRFHPDSRRQKKVIRTYRAQHPEGINFSTQEYEQAATVLCSFQPIAYEKAVTKYGQNIIDLLILAHGIYFMTEQKNFWRQHTVLHRLVSIRAIETDTEAGEGDE